MPESSNRKQRSTKPVAPENSALADELRSQLKGKPTKCGFNRSLTHEIGSFLGDIIKIAVVIVLCFVFTFGGFGAGMLLGYASTTKPLSIGDLTSAEESQTSFVYDIEGNVIAKLTGSDNVDRIYVSYSAIKNTYLDEAIVSIEDERFYEHSGIDIKHYRTPDLVLHKRGPDAQNLCVIEVKKHHARSFDDPSPNNQSKDIKVLEAMTAPEGAFRYRAGLLLILKKHKIEMLSFPERAWYSFAPPASSDSPKQPLSPTRHHPQS